MFPDITVGPRDLVESDVNKVGGDPTADAKPRTLLTIDIEDAKLITLKDGWDRKWKLWYNTQEKGIKESEAYWMGIQYSPITYQAQDRPIMDNLIFESLETFLPEATKQNPEAVIKTDNTVLGNVLAKNLKNTIAAIADKTRLRLKIKRQTRYWWRNIHG